MAGNGTLNRVELIGHLSQDPEARFTPAGIPVTNFRVATNYSYKTGEGEERTETEWTPIVSGAARPRHATHTCTRAAECTWRAG